LRFKNRYMEDYYQILGVRKNATKSEIKLAFRALARKYHPDIAGSDPFTLEYFKKVTQSYETLSDDEGRKKYDILRITKATMDFARPIKEGVDQALNRFSDVFSDLFLKNQKQRAQEASHRGENVYKTVTISFVASYTGAERNVKFPILRPCVVCGGSGAPKSMPPRSCHECGGRGTVISKGPIPFRRTCKRCDGAGQIFLLRCSTCSGKTITMAYEDFRIKIPAGVKDNTRLRVKRKGESVVKGAPPVDLHISIRLQADERFTRKNDNLYVTAKVTISSLLLGDKIPVEIPSGKILVTVPKNMQLNQVLRIKERGFPSLTDHTRGDLLITLSLQLPKTLLPKAEQAVRQLASTVPGF